ncbi:MAG: ATP-binding protein [Sulfurospirillum sp.]|nr:ATP-binding protein [Sulfurospirillum sp.]
MNISLENLGYIEKAEKIKLNKFNVYIGENSCGKTYFSKLTYYLSDFRLIFPIYKKYFIEKIQTAIESNLKEVTYTEDEVIGFFRKLENVIEKEFSMKLGLPKKNFKNFKLNLDVEFLDNKDIKISSNVSSKNNLVTNEKYACFDFMNHFNDYIVCHYLPAARSNYMVNYKHLISSMLMSFDNKLETSILPDIEMKFLNDIMNVDTKSNGKHVAYANLIEKEIFKNAKLIISSPKTQDMPTFKYKITNQKKSLDLVAASSSITELSPLLMYLRHGFLLKNSREKIIIDEPELSLHPKAQAKLVEILVKLCNDGLNITLVTHSPFILEALNNHLLRDKIKDKKLSKKIKAIPGISSDNVSAYLFEDNTIKDILDKDIKLIDDKLIDSFENLNIDYQKMRDIEFDEND